MAIQCAIYEEATEELEAERAAELDKAKEELKKIPKPKEEKKKVYTSGVGKYINPTLKKEARKTETDGESSAAKKKKTSSYAFKDFSAWQFGQQHVIINMCNVYGSSHVRVKMYFQIQNGYQVYYDPEPSWQDQAGQMVHAL